MEKEEFLRLLPKLIREDDEVKGAIITALSGVVATKDDIQRVIEHSDKRFEALQQETDKRFKAFQEELDKRFEIVDEKKKKNQEILISHSKSLEFIMKNMPNIQNLKDIDARMKRSENLSATQYKTLDGKIDTKFNELNEKLDVQGNDIKDIKKMLMDKH